MGCSPSATILYGIPVEDIYQEGSGIYDPISEEYAEKIGSSDVDDAMTEAGIEIVLGGDLTGEPLYYIAAVRSVQRGSWDSALEIDAEMMKKKSKWDDDIRKFCEIMEIDYHEPKFLMVCAYG